VLCSCTNLSICAWVPAGALVSISAGEWVEVEKLCSGFTAKNYRPLLYALYKQQYLELIDRQEYQKVRGARIIRSIAVHQSSPSSPCLVTILHLVVAFRRSHSCPES